MAPGTSAARLKPRRAAIVCLLAASLAFTTAGVARADMIQTEKVVNSTLQTYGDSALAFSMRSDVEYQLRSLGVGKEAATERVAALTDEEVRAVVGRLHSLYAGGQYVPPPVGAVGGLGGVYAGSGGGYGGGAGGYSGAAGGLVLEIGVITYLVWKLVQTNASYPGYMNANPLPLDPNRRISVQDCSRPIAFDGGNLRCK